MNAQSNMYKDLKYLEKSSSMRTKIESQYIWLYQKAITESISGAKVYFYI